jgi:polyisoprenoid-binding protein YceI
MIHKLQTAPTGGPPGSTEQEIEMKYEIDSAHTRIEFDAKHMVFTTVRGAFTEFEGSLEADGDDYSTLRGEIVLQAASVNTGDPKRDDHLRSADFFDVEKFATIKFVPTSVVAKDATNHVVTGDLTIKDVTRPIELKVEILGVINDPWGNARTALNLQSTINRKDWGLEWNMVLDAGNVLVSDKININVEAAVLHKLEAAVAAAA